MRRQLVLNLLTISLFSLPAVAEELVRLSSPELYELQTQGFEIRQAGKVQIDAVGRWPQGSQRAWSGNWDFFDSDDEDTRLTAYAWIVDADTREAVWKMEADECERFERSRTLREASATVSLEPGRYELYYWSGHLWQAQAQGESGKKRSRISWGKDDDDDDSLADLEADLKECFVALSSDALRKSELRLFTPDGSFGQPLVRMAGISDSQLRQQGFRMKSAGELRAYVLVEHGRSDMDAADFAWIVDLKSGSWVWDSSSRRGRNAGGASKNRKFDSQVRLNAGDYILCYGSDDSHSAGGFNSSPPDDPLNWGVTLFAGDGFAASNFQTIDVPARGKADLEFTRVGNGEFHEQPFRLAKETELQIHALGEMDSDGWVFHDYGWIADAVTGETVWEMDDRNTYPAGGAEKNRMFDGKVKLPAGQYIVFYTSDDSHSAEEWNAAAPFDGDAWGIALSGPGIERLDATQVQQATGVLVSLVRRRDDERERVRFELTTETKVEVHAVGEGVDDEMYDYGWIRDRDSGRTVWKMHYDETSHAGGASKNRMVREEITLPAGNYEVIYETDGSHSFSGWNDHRPDDPMSWGITVRKVR